MAEGGTPTVLAGDGGAAPAGGAPAAGAPAAAAAPASGTPWFDTFDADTKGWLSGMGLDKLDPQAALTKVLPMYRGAEQKLGVPADQVLRLPGDKATPDEIKAFRAKLGVPEAPDAYKLDDALKDDPVAGKFRAKAHELGVPAAQFEGIVQWFMGESAAAREAQEGQFAQQAEKDITDLKSEWKGEEFDKNIDLAKRVSRTMGLSPEEAQAVERAIGIKRAATVFSSLGKALGEHRFVGGQNGQQQFGMTAEGARARLADLKKDGAWMASYLSGDADKTAEWTRLHQVGFQDQEAA